MTTHHLNADFSQPTIVRTGTEEWQESPSPTVWRKRLDLSGPVEAGRVTSVVKYEPGSSFHSHPHPDGEEILVLGGVFSDEHGDYPAGSYLLNPEGFSHAPFSKEGCTLFVKLRQYPGTARQKIAINTPTAPWKEISTGVSEKILYQNEDYPETVRLVRMTTDAELTIPKGEGGAEMFVLKGAVDESDDTYSGGDWLRWSAVSDRTFAAREPFEAYLKTGHFPS